CRLWICPSLFFFCQAEDGIRVFRVTGVQTCALPISASLSGDALVLPESLQFKQAYEMAYGKPSSFLDQAKARGIPTSEGYGMLRSEERRVGKECRSSRRCEH